MKTCTSPLLTVAVVRMMVAVVEVAVAATLSSSRGDCLTVTKTRGGLAKGVRNVTVVSFV